VREHCGSVDDRQRRETTFYILILRAIMEKAFFVPCTRMHDLMRAWNVDHEHDDDKPFLFPEDLDFEEVELLAGAGNGAVDFLHPDFTFHNFWQLTRRKIVWMSPEIFVDAQTGNENVTTTNVLFRECFEYETLFSVILATTLDTSGDNKLLQVCSRSVTDSTTTACDYVFQLMTRSNAIWTGLCFGVLPSVSTHALSQFLKNSRSSGGNISFEHYDLSDLSQDYLRVFEVSTGPHHRIELESGTNPNWSQLQAVTVASFLQSCQCAIVLHCRSLPVPSPLIIDALKEDCDIVELYLHQVPDIDGLVRALAKNKSLVRLSFVGIRISDDNWTVLCRSLSRLPKLEYLRLSPTFPLGLDHNSNESKTRRTNVFLKMLQANTVLQELEASRYVTSPLYDEFDERILVDVIQPYFRRLPHVRAFGKYRGPEYARVLARALYKVNDSPALTWMLIRSNIPALLGLGGNELGMVPDTKADGGGGRYLENEGHTCFRGTKERFLDRKLLHA
jgi:hypothetical protein